MKAVLVYSTKWSNTNRVLEKEFETNLKKSTKVATFDKRYSPSSDYVNHLNKFKTEGQWKK